LPWPLPIATAACSGVIQVDVDALMPDEQERGKIRNPNDE
jgi:hypothetical protein